MLGEQAPTINEVAICYEQLYVPNLLIVATQHLHDQQN